MSLHDKTHNFATALPEHLREQAEEMLKSQYSLEFLGLAQAVHERDLEQNLISRLKDFLIELGYGFCFILSNLSFQFCDRKSSLDFLAETSGIESPLVEPGLESTES